MKYSIRLNSKLSAEFTDYISKHPERMRVVPKNAYIIFTTSAQPALSKKNIELAARVCKTKKTICFRANRVSKGWRLMRLNFKGA